MRLSGAGIIWICLTVTGFRISARFKKRRSLLEATVIMIVKIKIDLDYRRDVIINLIRRVSFDSVSDKLDYLKLCEDYLESGVDFPSAWKKALKESKCQYTQKERNKLISLGEILGTTDTDSQITMLNLYEEYMKDFLNNAEKSQREYGRLSSIMGFLSGFAIFILAL